MAQFTGAIQQWVLASEGGYVDHPSDPGGATNLGITHKTLAAWRGKPVTKQDVRNLTRDEALQIYKAQYWDAVRGDQLPAGLDYAVFDYAVNSGPARAVKDLQRVLGVGVDGIVGAQTLAAANARSASDLINALCDRRLEFVRGLSTYATFGRGWESRIASVRRNSLSIVTGGTTTMPQAGQGRAAPETPSATDTLLKDAGGLSGLAGGAAAIAGAIANQPILQIAAVAFIAFLLWRFVIARKQADPA